MDVHGLDQTGGQQVHGAAFTGACVVQGSVLARTLSQAGEAADWPVRARNHRSAAPLRPTPDATTYVERPRAARRNAAPRRQPARPGCGAERHRHDRGAKRGAAYWPGVPTRLHHRHLQLRLDLIDAGSNRDLSQLGTDALLQFGCPSAQEAMLRTLAESRWPVVASPAYWACHGAPSHPSELAGHPCMTAREGLQAGALQPVLFDWVGVSSPPLNLLIPQGGVAAAARGGGGRLPGRGRCRPRPSAPVGRACPRAACSATRLVQATGGRLKKKVAPSRG